MIDPTEIHHWLRLDDRTTTSGQPTQDQLPALAALGVSTVLNLALHSHPKALVDEAASVAALGMRYVHIPVDFGNPTEGDFTLFCDALDEASRDFIHVHCIANYRVSAFFYRYRVAVLGWAPDDAVADLHSLWRPEGVWVEFITRELSPAPDLPP